MILIISHPDDLHAREVMSHLHALSAPADILNLAEFPRAARLDLRFGPDQTHLRYRTASGDPLDLDSVGAVWWRRPQHFVFDEGLQAADYAASECEEAFGGLWQAMRAGWINPPVLDAAASRKSLQLSLAATLGLAPPQTCITNCPETAEAFVAEIGDVIYKPFAATLQYWRETRRFGAAERAQIANIRHAPTILQERIDGKDIRVTVVGNEIFPAEIDVSGGNYADDFRMNHNVSIRPTTLPDDVTTGIRRMMARLGLVYGAFDFRRGTDGQFSFLEVNPAGQFLFIEYETGQPIAQAMARQLVTMAEKRATRICTAPHTALLSGTASELMSNSL